MLAGKAIFGALFVAAMVTSSWPAMAMINADLRCRLGAYALSDGRYLAITGFESEAKDLRYVLSTGEYGHLTPSSDNSYALMALAGPSHDYGTVLFSDCATGKVTFAETGKTKISGKQLHLKAVETFFNSGTTLLHGRLVMPVKGKASAIIVEIQGSEDDPGTDVDEWQYLLPQHGIGVFTYDKRGSGQSQGELSADFNVRAADTAAAVQKARELAPRVKNVGVFGGSQGGWIAPLTATKTDLDFVIVGYGLAEGVTAQDRDEVEEKVRDAGFGNDVMPKVREITAATERVVKSEWQSGWKELAEVEHKYSNEPWYKAINGENGYTAILLRTPEAQAREMGPKLDKHVSFNYDPAPVIASIAPRQLWVLGGSDRTAPNTRTIEILHDIQKRKTNLDLAIYRKADHGIVESFSSEGFERHRFPRGYFDLIANWVRTDDLPRADEDLQL